MWPFKKKKSDSRSSMEWLPRAVDTAAQKWIDFECQPFASNMTLAEKLFRFSEGLGADVKQWQGLHDLQDNLVFLIAAKGVEKSKTHLRIEIETAVGFALPSPHERTDEEENEILMNRIVDRARRKWQHFHETIKFKDSTSLRKKIEIFQVPFSQGIKRALPMFVDAPDDFFFRLIVLGIVDSGTLSTTETDMVLGWDS